MSQQIQKSCNAAFRGNPHGGAAIARQRIDAAVQSIDLEGREPLSPERNAAVLAALNNAEAWHEALCAHGMAVDDDYQRMEDLRIRVARLTTRPVEPERQEDSDAALTRTQLASRVPERKEDGDMNWMQIIVPAGLGVMSGLFLGGMFDE